MNTLVRMAAEMCRRAAEKTGLRRIVLSGGVFQNMYLLSLIHIYFGSPTNWWQGKSSPQGVTAMYSVPEPQPEMRLYTQGPPVKSSM